MSTIQSLLEGQDLTTSLLETNAQVLDTSDMLEEALAEASGLENHSFKLSSESFPESPAEGEFDHLQFFNQDQLHGMSQNDLNDLNPDNTVHLNKFGSDTDSLTSPVQENTVAFLLEGVTEDDISEDELDDIEDDEDY